MFLSLTQDIPSNHAVPLEQYDHHWCLVNNNGKFELVSNICPHQNAKLCVTATEQFVCGYHGKTFDICGTGVNTALKLPTKTVYSVDALLLDQSLPISIPCNLEYMRLQEYRKDFVRSSPDIIMDVFLDIEHIDHAHAGLYDQKGLDTLEQVEVSVFSNGSAQSVISDRATYAIDADKEIGLAAYWLAIYPYTMIEWQPGALYVTVANKISDASSCVHVFKYYDTRYDTSVVEFNNKVWETAWSQDRRLSESVVAMPTQHLSQLKQHYFDWRKNAQ